MNPHIAAAVMLVARLRDALGAEWMHDPLWEQADAFVGRYCECPVERSERRDRSDGLMGVTCSDCRCTSVIWPIGTAAYWLTTDAGTTELRVEWDHVTAADPPFDDLVGRPFLEVLACIQRSGYTLERVR